MFILLTFVVLTAAFYEMSGGSDYAPETREMAEADAALAETSALAQVTSSETNIATDPIVAPAAPALVSAFVAPARPDYMPASLNAGEGEALLTQEQLAELNRVPDPAPEAAAPIRANAELFQVAGSRVNMREGPGTTFGVIDTLAGGTRAEVIERDVRLGWARIRVVSNGRIGWMAERLLEPANG